MYFQKPEERRTATLFSRNLDELGPGVVEQNLQQLSKFPEFCQFIRWCLVQYGNDGLLPLGVRQFIAALSKNSPVCSIIFPSDIVTDLVKELCDSSPLKQKPPHLKKLQEHAPLIFALYYDVEGDVLPSPVRQLLLKLVDIASAPFVDRESPLDCDEEFGNVLVDSLLWFPSLEKKRSRGLFNMDKNNNQERTCNKKSTKHPTLLPGVFLLHCQHGSLGTHLS